jgi:hypothetical protein
MAALKRVSIGFRGGQVLSIRLADDALAALEGALGGGGWHEVAHDEGSARVNLDQVVYVQVDSAEPRVGFGA